MCIRDSIYIDFLLGRPNYKQVQKQRMATWALQARLQARVRLTRPKLWSKRAQKGSQMSDVGTLLGIILLSFSGSLPSLVLASIIFSFLPVSEDLFVAFVGFGYPFGDHFALIFRSLKGAFPSIVFALIFPHNIYVMGHLFSRPWVCRGLVLEFQNSTPPRPQELRWVIVVLYRG